MLFLFDIKNPKTWNSETAAAAIIAMMSTLFDILLKEKKKKERQTKPRKPYPALHALRDTVFVSIYEPWYWYSVLNSSQKFTIKLLSTYTTFYHVFQIKAAI